MAYTMDDLQGTTNHHIMAINDPSNPLFNDPYTQALGGLAGGLGLRNPTDLIGVLQPHFAAASNSSHPNYSSAAPTHLRTVLNGINGASGSASSSGQSQPVADAASSAGNSLASALSSRLTGAIPTQMSLASAPASLPQLQSLMPPGTANINGVRAALGQNLS